MAVVNSFIVVLGPGGVGQALSGIEENAKGRMRRGLAERHEIAKGLAGHSDTDYRQQILRSANAMAPQAIN
jgi:hypothetical protein